LLPYCVHFGQNRLLFMHNNLAVAVHHQHWQVFGIVYSSLPVLLSVIVGNIAAALINMLYIVILFFCLDSSNSSHD